MLEFHPPDDLDLTLIVKFFWLFSGMESVLKRKGFVKMDRFHNALPDWTKFEDEIESDLSGVDELQFLRAVTYLVQHPPKRQKFDGTVVKWEAQMKNPLHSDNRFALMMARSVRNNLFHGGKYPQMEIEAVERNRVLIESAYLVLCRCVELRKTMFGLLPYVA